MDDHGAAFAAVVEQIIDGEAVGDEGRESSTLGLIFFRDRVGQQYGHVAVVIFMVGIGIRFFEMTAGRTEWCGAGGCRISAITYSMNMKAMETACQYTGGLPSDRL